MCSLHKSHGLSSCLSVHLLAVSICPSHLNIFIRWHMCSLENSCFFLLAQNHFCGKSLHTKIETADILSLLPLFVDIRRIWIGFQGWFCFVCVIHFIIQTWTLVHQGNCFHSYHRVHNNISALARCHTVTDIGANKHDEKYFMTDFISLLSSLLPNGFDWIEMFVYISGIYFWVRRSLAISVFIMTAIRIAQRSYWR